MAWYIQDSFKYFIKGGFSTKEDAENYIRNHEYMSQYWYAYNAVEWTNEHAYMIIDCNDSIEEHSLTGPLFHNYNEAWDWICENAMFYRKFDDWTKLIQEIRM